MPPSNLPDLPAGIYRHYKGPHYQVFGYGHDANILDRWGVVYMGLELTDAHKGPRFAFRNIEGEDNFFDWVHPHSGTVCRNHSSPPNGPGACMCKTQPVNSVAVRRFEYVGPMWQGK